MSPMMRDLVDLVLTWWKRDLIRARPSEGRLFRLRPGAVLCFSPSPDARRVSAEVVARRVSQDPHHPRIYYDCRDSQEDEITTIMESHGGQYIHRPEKMVL